MQRLVLQVLRKAGESAQVSEEDSDRPSFAGCEVLAGRFLIDLRMTVRGFVVRRFG